MQTERPYHYLSFTWRFSRHTVPFLEVAAFLFANMLANRMRAAVGVIAVVRVLMRVGFRGAEVVAEGKGGNKEEEKEEREENTAEQRFEGGRIHGCGVG